MWGNALIKFHLIDEMPNCLSFRQPRMYADDTRITCVGAHVNSLQLNLNHDLENLIKSWLSLSNKLTLDATNYAYWLQTKIYFFFEPT